MIQGVEGQEPPWVEKPQVNVDTGIKKDACCVDSRGDSKSWHVGAVEHDVPHEVRRRTHGWERWRSDDDEDDDEDEDERNVE
eukprot:8011992-Karenia_brevis.AAC.1